MIIKLHLESTTKGALYLCDERGDEFEIDCELEFGFTEGQKQTLIDPAYDAEMELISVKCVLGEIQIDAIQNMDRVSEDALTMLAQEVYEAKCEAADFRREEARYE